MAIQSDGSDANLMQRIASGNEDAFVDLYRRTQRGVYRFALHMSGSAEAAEDVTQEVFLALIRHPQSFDPGRGSLSAFLYGIARKKVLRHFEQRNRSVQLPDDSGEDQVRVPLALVSHTDPLSELAENETLLSLRRAILALPALYREVVVFCDLQELSYEDTAAIVGCSVGTIRSRLHRARAILSRRLHQTNLASSGSRCATVKRCIA